jgi:hypothetical protein
MQSETDMTDEIFSHYCCLGKAIMKEYGRRWQT